MNKLMRKPPREFWMSLVLVLLTCSAYFYLPYCGFVAYDDQIFVTSNKLVQAGLTWKGLVHAFTSAPLNLYTPLALVSHMLDCQLFGLNAGDQHLMSLFIHLLNTLLVFFVLNKMTREAWPSWAAAALFGLHPMHVEAVAWIAERKEILSTLFGLLAILAYVAYSENRRRSNYVFVFLFLLLSLLAKPMLVTLPFVLLLLDFWPLKRLDLFEVSPPREDGKALLWPNRLKPGWGRQLVHLLREKIPLFVLVLGFSLGTYLSNKLGGTLLSTQFYPFYMRVETVLYAYGQYIAKLFFPVGLSVFYPIPDLRLTLLTVIPPLLLLLAVSVLALRLAHKASYLLVGWFWFLGTLVPVIGLIHVGSMQAYADRYTYFTYTGAFIALVWLVYRWVKGKGLRARIALYAFCLILLALGTQTALQVMVWKDSESLFTHSLEVAPKGNYVALSSLGMVYYRKYKDVEGAKKLLKRSISVGATAPTWENLGSILLHQGKFKEAEACLRQGLMMSAQNVDRIWSDLAYACVQQGKYKEGLDFAEKSAVKRPDNPYVRMYQAQALLGLGRCGQAERVARQALILNPNIKGLSICVVAALMGQGRAVEAKHLTARIVDKSHGNPSVYSEVARELLLIPNPNPSTRQEALAMARKAVVSTKGGQPWYLLTLGRALRANSQSQEAAQVLTQCLTMAKTKKMEGLVRLTQRELKQLSNREGEQDGASKPDAKS